MNNFILKSVKTGELVIVESLEKAYELLQTGEYLFGFLSFFTAEELKKYLKAVPL